MFGFHLFVAIEEAKLFSRAKIKLFAPKMIIIEQNEEKKVMFECAPLLNIMTNDEVIHCIISK